jgi:hypothetical protein
MTCLKYFDLEKVGVYKNPIVIASQGERDDPPSLRTAFHILS